MKLSSRVSLKFSNINKKILLSEFIDEYRRVAAKTVKVMWKPDTSRLQSFAPKDITDQLKDTWLSASAIQAAAKDAIGVINATKQKQSKRQFVVNALISEGKTTKAKKLQAVIDRNNLNAPDCSNLEPQLDSRFAKVCLVTKTKEFDGWIELGRLGKKMRIVFPFKKHKHFNGLAQRGHLMPSIKLSKTTAQFCFEIPDVGLPKQTGNRLGVDIGLKSLISTSDGHQTKPCIHGHTFESLSVKMCRLKKGSKAYGRAKAHRINIINRQVKQVDLTQVQTIAREDLRQLVGADQLTKKFTHGIIAAKLDAHALQHGVRVVRIAPAFTSQRCSCCGWVHSSNRKLEQFCCGNCGHAANADINAQVNIGMKLPPVKAAMRQTSGFFWMAVEEPTVSPFPQTDSRLNR